MVAASGGCRRPSAHLPLLLVTMTLTLAAVSAQRSYRRRVGLLRSSTNHMPTDPWQLFNISVTQTGNRTEGRPMGFTRTHESMYTLELIVVIQSIYMAM